MIRADQRVLTALEGADHALLQWLQASLNQFQNDLIDANTDRMAARLAGKCEVLRDIINSAKSARTVLERIRSE